MSTTVLLDPVVTVDGTALAKVKAIEIKTTAADLDDTSADDGGYAVHAAGIRNGTCRIMFNQGWGTNSADALLSSKVGQEVEVVARPKGTATSATNPTFTFDILILEGTLMGGQIGDIMTDDITYPIQGAVVKTTS